MKQLVVISGKGGTGKTSLVACLAALLRPVVLVDCDVEAADLHLVIPPRATSADDFYGGNNARIRADRCRGCGKCVELCRFDAVAYDGPVHGNNARTCRIDGLACEGCGVCVDHCPQGAIELAPVVTGKWFVSETDCGPMIHARLGVAGENSGKLVTQLRRTAQKVADARRLDWVVCDGSPGIGCPVIASLTGASMALYVVEPTMTGLHDFHRVAQLAQRMSIPGMLVVNKADLNVELAHQLEDAANEYDIETLGRVPFDTDVTRAQVAGRSVVEHSVGEAAEAMRRIGREVRVRLARDAPPADGLTILSGPSMKPLD